MVDMPPEIVGVNYIFREKPRMGHSFSLIPIKKSDKILLIKK